MCERSENEVVPISRLFNCSAEFELPKNLDKEANFCDVAEISYSFSQNYSRVQALVQQ